MRCTTFLLCVYVGALAYCNNPGNLNSLIQQDRSCFSRRDSRFMWKGGKDLIESGRERLIFTETVYLHEQIFYIKIHKYEK